ncbi:MAG: GMC family oxidoreductase [Polyangiaceae bacterium]|jgi:choline dehydrogenase-like flavoprotein
MTGVLASGATLGDGARLDADAVVVGTGAGGSMVLRELARAGVSAVAFEEGDCPTPGEFDQREDHMLPRLFQDAGGRSTEDMAIRVLQGRGVGGSTVHNTNLCKRAPDAVLDIWARRHGVAGAGARDLAPAFERVEADLSVREIPAELRNRNNEVLRQGCEALGWRGGPLRHNRIGCQESGFCELGCAYNAKQNAVKVLIPEAIDAGARVYTDTEVVRLTCEGTRVVGVEAVARGPGGAAKRISARSRVVVLAASAVGSAVLALRSALPDPHDQLGRGLRLHPGAIAAGRFDRLIAGWRGIPQSFECTEHLDHAEGSDRRVWIVPAFAHPVGAAVSLTGFGAAHMASMREYPRLAVLSAMVHDETPGRVWVDGGGHAILRYAMSDADRRQLARGLAACARLLLAAGAREVTIPAIPSRTVKTLDELDRLDMSFVGPHRVPMTAVHPMGGMAMGEDPRRSVVRSTGEHHQVRGLFVADGSLFPTSLGGPPQLTIYALALHLSRHVVERAS